MTRDTQQLHRGIEQGDRRMLAKGITLVESTRHEDVQLAQELVGSLMGQTGRSIRLGITGVPGVGKSTFIEALGDHLIGRGHRVAVLAVDPSSPYSGGSILGDKTRMQELAARPEAFIRPSPTGGTLGGVARRTRESMLLCEAAGFDVILVETVGVGQSEYEVASMVDFFLVLMLPGAGDALQGIKKGIIESADMLVINKADGDNEKHAKKAKSDYEQALKLLAGHRSDRDVPQVQLCSSTRRQGTPEVWQHVTGKISQRKESGYFEQNRLDQLYNWMVRMAEEGILSSFRENPDIRGTLQDFRKQLSEGKITPVLASMRLVEQFRKALQQDEQVPRVDI